MSKSVRAYRSSAIEGATHIDILLACYDALAEEIRFAGNFAAKGDIAARCHHSQRALLLIGHLESWVSLLDDPDLSTSLARFYEYLRAEILRLQSSGKSDEFVNLALVVCQTRATWQKKQSAGRLQVGANAEPPCLVEGSVGSTSRFVVSA